MTRYHGAGAPFRRTGFAAVGLLLALGLTATAPGGAGAAGAADPGQGTAVAQVMRVDPRAGSLSIGVGVGEALAGHQNLSAKAQSLSLDLGVVGTSLTTSSCNSPAAFQPNQLPQTLIVENGQPNADKGVTVSQDGGAFTEFGQAQNGPYSKAVTTISPVSVPGLMSISGGTATSWSGIVKGQRQAGATVDISGISILGQVSLAGLHWEVLHQSTGTEQHTGSFSISSVKVGGAVVPTPNVVQSLAQANALLNLLGIVLSPPNVHLTQGIEYVDPLQIAVVPNAARDKIAATLIGALQPVRQPLFAAILAQICKASTPIEVADIAIGAATGAGSFDVQLGGLQAGTGLVAKNSFDLGLPGAGGISLPASNDTSGISSTPGVPGSNPTSGDSSSIVNPSSPSASSGLPTTPSSGGGTTQAIRPITAQHGKRGGALIAVALVGLGALALIAEGDRRMMRRAQRTVIFED